MSEMRRPTEAATGALSEARDKTANRSYEQMMIWRAASVKAAMDQNNTAFLDASSLEAQWAQVFATLVTDELRRFYGK